MLPTLLDGDYILVRRRNHDLKTGDIVVLHRAGEPRLVKRLARPAAQGGFHLAGDGIASQPSIDLGTVMEDQIEGRAILRISGSRVTRLDMPIRRRGSDSQ